MTPPAKPVRRPVSPPPHIVRWSLLPHSMSLRGQTTHRILNPNDMNPGFWRGNGVRQSDALQKIVQDAINANGDLERLRFAIVDLSDNGRGVAFAGHNSTEQVFCGSMAKMACVYAAHQLKFDLNALAADEPALTTKKALFDRAWEIWVKTQALDPAATVDKFDLDLSVQGSLVLKSGSIVQMSAGGQESYQNWNPKQPNPRADASPNLPAIFDVDESARPLKVTFKKSRDPKMLALLSPDEDTDYLLNPNNVNKKFKDRLSGFRFEAGHAATYETLPADVKALFTVDSKDGVPFFERMLLMGDESNNHATRTCVLDVGYLYIASALWQSGLFSTERKGGFWLGAPYVIGPGWITNPAPVPAAGSNDSRKYQCTTAATSAAYMTLLAQGRLISEESSNEVKFVFDKVRTGHNYTGDSGTYPGNTKWLARSYIQDALGFDTDELYSKIGYNWKVQHSDCAYIRHSHHGKELTYVMSFADLAVEDWHLVGDLVPALDQCILKYNTSP